MNRRFCIVEVRPSRSGMSARVRVTELQHLDAGPMVPVRKRFQMLASIARPLAVLGVPPRTDEEGFWTLRGCGFNRAISAAKACGFDVNSPEASDQLVTVIYS